MGKSGITDKQSAALTASAADVEEIVFRASNYSVYSVTEQMKQGFITGAHGERIGLAGMYVYEGGEAFTVRDVTSLNIRVPHEVRGCAEQILSCCFRNVRQAHLYFPRRGAVKRRSCAIWLGCLRSAG